MLISCDEVRFELREPELPDDIIEKQIERSKAMLMGYTNNQNLFDNELDNLILSEIVLYLVCMRLNPSLRGMQGVASENAGDVNYSPLNDIPEHYKRTLMRFTRARFR